jgi:protocatechuate 3,4-dioxygenase beta subunit
VTNRFAQARATRIFGLATAVGIMIACGLVGLGSLAARAQEAPTPRTSPAGPAAATRNLNFPQNVTKSEIAGVVVDSAGKPLSGCLVDAWTWYPGDETHTDENGAFRLRPINNDPQHLEVRVSKPGYSPYYNPQLLRGQKDLVITLGNKTYVEGTVRDGRGTPVPAATIVGQQGPKQGDGVLVTEVRTSTTSDARGHYRLYLFPDNYEILVAVPGAGTRRLTGVTLAPDQSRQIELDLQPGVRFQAKVVDVNTAKPVEKFVLYSWRDKRILGVSDAQGKLVIDEMLPGKVEFNVGFGKPKGRDYDHGELGRWWSGEAVNEWQRKTIEPSGWQRNFDDLTFNLSPDMKPVLIEVEQGTVFSGHVYDPDGNPVFGATVAPAHSGTGNSLTGDTRYSVRTASDGSYRAVMPASNRDSYNLMAHDGAYGRWRKWANAVSEPVRSSPGQRFENFDLKLTRGATVRGRVTTDGRRLIGKREVRAQAADLLENRYYDPTVKVREDGSFELKLIRPGKNYIQLSPFWLSAANAPRPSSVMLDLKASEVREGIELHVPDGGPVDAALGLRDFRITVFDHAGKPAANRRVAVSRANGGGPASRSFFTALVGPPGGLSKRISKENPDGRDFTTGADGTVTIPGKTLFDRGASVVTVFALDADREEGAFGILYADLETPELTLRLSAFCDTTATISKDKLPPPDAQTYACLTSGGKVLVPFSVDERVDLQLPMGDYTLTVSSRQGSAQAVKFSVKANQERLDLGSIALTPHRVPPPSVK